MLADSVVWLFVARGCRGSRRASRSALRAPRCSTSTRAATRRPSGSPNGVMSASGLGLGMLMSSTAVELLPHRA